MFLLDGNEARRCGRGTHYAIPAAWVDPDHLDRASAGQLRAFVGLLGERSQELSARGWAPVTGTAWPLIHRCLTDGTLDGGFTAGHLCVLGRTDAYWVERDGGAIEWIVNLLGPADVREAAAFARDVDATEFRRRYDTIGSDGCDDAPGEAHFESALDQFLRLQNFLGRAAAAGRWVVFVAGGPTGSLTTTGRPNRPRPRRFA